MYDRLLKLIENDKWRTVSREPAPGSRVPPDKIRGNRTAPGMMGGMRSVGLNASIPKSDKKRKPVNTQFDKLT